jgi:hypothetical protein
MRLYSRDGATAVSHGGATYTAGPDGGFDFPEEAGLVLHAFHAGKAPLWETDIERQARLAAEQAELRKDPATLLDAVNQLVAAAQAAAPAPPAPAVPAREPRSRKGATAGT